MNSKKMVGIWWLMVLSLIAAGCSSFSGPSPTPTGSPTVSPSAPPTTTNSEVTTTTSSLVLTTPSTTKLVSVSPEIETIVIDNPVPASYTTYTDPNGLFKISYPGDWVIPPEYATGMVNSSSQMAQFLDGRLSSPVGGPLLIAQKSRSSYPYVVVDFVNGETNPVPGHDKDFRLYKTTVDGRTAMVVETILADPDKGRFRGLTLQILVNGNAWRIDCATWPDDYKNWVSEFKSILGSFRILK
jgi:hypothetical protein